MKIISISSANDIPENANLLIYGAGGRGFRLVNLLTKFRPDIRVIGFLDSHEEKNIDQYKVYRVSSLEPLLKEYSQISVIIASAFANQIYCELLKFNLNYIYVVDPYIVTPTKYIFQSIDEIRDFENHISDISYLFKKQSNKDFLMCIPDLYRLNKDPKLIYCKLVDFFLSLNEQYFDYINKDVIKTIIDGGMENGGTSLRFLHHFSGCTIYAFEPLEAAVKLSPFYTYIKNCSQINVCFKGLSDEPTSGRLNIDPDCFGGNRITTTQSCQYSTHVETTTIDDYVKNNNISKIDYIKLDIESYEIKALNGARKTIIRDRPQLAICIYHIPEHYYKIPLLVQKICTDYNFYLGFYGIETFLETVLYCIPKEIDKN